MKINRSAEGYVSVTSKGQDYPTIHLIFYPLDPDTADRIEYAMKFLAMSCNASAATFIERIPASGGATDRSTDPAPAPAAQTRTATPGCTTRSDSLRDARHR